MEKAALEPISAGENSADCSVQPATADDLDSSSAATVGSFARTPILAQTKDHGPASWIAQSLPWLKENLQAIWKIAAGIVVAAVLAIGAFWYFGTESPSSTGAPLTQDAGQSSGVLYAVRLTNVRNAPTSIGTVVVGEVQAGRAISGTWVLGQDGVTRWLRVQLQNGSQGFVWGRNLFASAANSGTVPPSITLLRDQSIKISTGQINPGVTADFTLMGDRPNQTGAEEKAMNLRSRNGGPNAVDSARSAVMSATEPGYRGCSTVSFSDDIIGISAMLSGTWFCLKGTDGQLAEMKLDRVLDNPDGIRIVIIPLH